MPVVVTSTQKTLFFQMMDLIKSTGWMTTDSMGVTVADMDLASSIASSTKLKVIDYIDNTLTDDERTSLIEILTEYDAIKFCDGTQEAGNVGTMTGMNFNFASYKKNLKDLAQAIVPVFTIWEVEARRLGQTKGNDSSTVRFIH